MNLLFIPFLLSVFLSNLYSKEINLSLNNTNYIGSKTKIYIDYKNNKNIQDIRKLDKEKFKILNNKVDSRVFTQNSVWYKFTVINPYSKVLNRYIIFDIPWLDNINIYVFNKNKLNNKYTIGNIYPYNQRSYKVPFLNSKHSFKKGYSEIYINVKTRDPFIVPISILDEKTFIKKIYSNNIFEFSLYSIIISMLIFNFILYFIIKNNIYLYYSFFLFTFLIMNSSYNNYTFEYLFYDYPNIQNWVQSFSIFIFSISGLLFAKSFLELKHNFKFFNKLTNMIIFIFITLMCSIYFFGYHYHIISAILLSIFFTLYVFYIACCTYKLGNKSAIFFIIGTIAGLIGTIITALTVIAVIPYSWLGYKAIDIGIVLDTILLSIALANKYTLLHNNLHNTKIELSNLNANLEKQVQERTNDLILEVKNKNILLKELSHRVKNNLQIISSMLHLQSKDLNDPIIKKIIDENTSRINSIAILYESLLNSKDLEHIQLNIYIEDIIENIKRTFDNKNIIYKLDLINSGFLTNNLIPIGLIVNELITNSLKYAFDKNDTQNIIELKIEKNNNYLIINYKDNGKGASLDKIKKGFGYKLLTSLVKYQLNGEITYFNKNGLNYKLTFPTFIFEN